MDWGVVKVAAAAAALVLCLSSCSRSPETELRRRLASQTTGTLNLPPGDLKITEELRLAPGAHDLDIVGSGTLLKATNEFKGRAVLVIDGARNIRLRDFTVDGNRVGLEKQMDLPPPAARLRDETANNGILLDQVQGIEISNLTLANIPNFAILVSRSSEVRAHHLHIEDSGSLDAHNHANGTGGIVFEDGSKDFEVRSTNFRRLRGNALWTRSASGAPRQDNGVFASNRFETIGHDAILLWQASRIRVEENTGAHIGYPAENVAPEAVPAALASAGNVDHSAFVKNQFEEVNGNCFALDGFHDGMLMKNLCFDRKLPTDYPFGHIGIVMNNTETQAANIEITGNVIDGMKYGGLLLIGTGHRVIGNRFDHVNKAQCDDSGKNPACVGAKNEPKMLAAGIYLAHGAARPSPAKGNTIRDNKISGFKIKSHCIVAAPGAALEANSLQANQCSDFDLVR